MSIKFFCLLGFFSTSLFSFVSPFSSRFYVYLAKSRISIVGCFRKFLSKELNAWCRMEADLANLRLEGNPIPCVRSPTREEEESSILSCGKSFDRLFNSLSVIKTNFSLFMAPFRGHGNY